MLESYDDTGRRAAGIICLIGLIVFTIGAWHIYSTDNEHITCERECFEYADRARVKCECERFEYDGNEQEADE